MLKIPLRYLLNVQRIIIRSYICYNFADSFLTPILSQPQTKEETVGKINIFIEQKRFLS